MQNEEAVKGVAPTGVFQLRIDDEWSNVINFENDSIGQVRAIGYLNKLI